MATNGEDLNGWPELEREPVTLPELSERPSWPELARAYGTIALAWQRLWPRVIDALVWLRGAWMGTRGALERLEERSERRHQELLEEMRKRPSTRPKALSAFAPEQTIGGGIRLEGTAWEAIQKQQVDLEEQLDELRRQKAEAEAEARGQRNAVAGLQTSAKSRRELALFVLTLLSTAGAVLSWVLAHAR